MMNDEFDELKELLEKTKKDLNKTLAYIQKEKKENDNLIERVDNLLNEVRRFNNAGKQKQKNTKGD